MSTRADRGNKGNKHAAKTNPPTGDEGGYSRNQTEEKANGGRRGGIQVTNTGMFARTRNGTENLDQLLTSWLEAEETAQDGSHPQQGQCYKLFSYIYGLYGQTLTYS